MFLCHVFVYFRERAPLFQLQKEYGDSATRGNKIKEAPMSE